MVLKFLSLSLSEQDAKLNLPIEDNGVGQDASKEAELGDTTRYKLIHAHVGQFYEAMNIHRSSGTSVNISFAKYGWM